ncbi:hypothetical protein [Xenorhabdus taiwanensis]|uniref:Uncharacterized protein n=1 Tax=Xenorhabdus taiwanensis TaxID=3085177 RepID=A0ABN7C283_9GAMM|nr:hypothetical protein TCT1_13810 [Xenorhabdus sp. TCT-1]
MPVGNQELQRQIGFLHKLHCKTILSGKALSDVLQWERATEINPAENSVQREEIGVSGQRVISRITLTPKEEALLPAVMRFTASMGYPISNKSMAMMFVKGMSISFDDQRLRVRDGEVRLMDTPEEQERKQCEFEARKQARREALRLRIKKIGEMRKNNDELQRYISTGND